MSNNNDDMKFPWVGCGIVTVLVIALVIMTMISIGKGAAAFLESGGGTWLLVIGGFGIFIYLVSKASNR